MFESVYAQTHLVGIGLLVVEIIMFESVDAQTHGRMLA